MNLAAFIERFTPLTVFLKKIRPLIFLKCHKQDSFQLFLGFISKKPTFGKIEQLFISKSSHSTWGHPSFLWTRRGR